MISLEPPRALLPDPGLSCVDGPANSFDPWQKWGLSRAGLSRFLRLACGAAGLRGEVDVLLADDQTLRRLNRQFRGKNKATDVLSFPAPEELTASHAGDLAISLETATRQAAEQGHTLRDEVRVLLLHGVLHLAGFDHETDGGEMAAREAALRVRWGLPSGLIARSARTIGANESKTSQQRRATAKPGRRQRVA